MPPMRFCGRHWHCADDDLHLLGCLSIVANALNAAACAVLAAEGEERGSGLALWLAASGGVSGAAVLLDTAISFVSRRGALLDPAPRAGLNSLLTLRSLLVVCQAATLVGGTVVAGMDGRALSSAAVLLFVARWSAFCVWLSILCGTSSGAGAAGEVLLRLTQRLITCLACCVGIGRHDTELIQILAELDGLAKGFEATVSDVVAGLALVGDAQHSARCGREAPSLVKLHPHTFPSGSENEALLLRSRGGALPHTRPMTNRALLEELLHTYCFATASYGVVWHSLAGRNRLRDAPRQQGPASHRLDKRAAVATLRGWPGHEASVLCHFSRANSVKVPVYSVFADPAYKRVVVAVRGTLSVSDLLTDILARPVEDEESRPTSRGTRYVHEGMWESAQGLHRELQRRGLLQALLSGGAQASPLAAAGTEGERRALPDCRGYGLLVTGHSLGGGVALLLAMLLRRDYGQVRCIAYAPPPTCSERVAHMHRQQSVTVVHGDDFVPRLSARHLALLREQMLALSAHCPLPKHAIAWRALRKRDNAPLAACLATQPVSPQARKAMAFQGREAGQPRFFHVGQVCYLRVLESKKSCCGRLLRDTRYTVESAASDDFGELVISRRMAVHHMPPSYRRGLELALQGWPAAPQRLTCWDQSRDVRVMPSSRDG